MLSQREALLALFLLIALPACQSKPDSSIKLGINAWPAYEFLYLAQERGYFKELGVPLKLVEYASLSDTRRGYERGKLNAMASTQVELLQVKAYSKRNPQIVLALDYSVGGDVIIAQRSIESIAELKGKRIGANSKSLPLYVLSRALQKSDLKFRDVQLQSMDDSAIVDAFGKGELDAAVTYTPYSNQLLQNGSAHIIFSSADLTHEITDVLSIEQDVLLAHPEYIDKIKQAWQKALDFTKQHPDQAYQIMSQRENISQQRFINELQTIRLLDLEQQSNFFEHIKNTIETTRNTLVDMNALPNDTPTSCCIDRIENMATR